MPTVIAHTAQGLLLGAALPPSWRTGRLWFLVIVCSILPDLDSATFALGIPYAHPFGHRGFFHSLTFAALHGLGVAWLFFRKDRLPPRRLLALGASLSALTGLHVLLDAMTNGGLGIALLAPFDNSRIFFPWTPIEVSPIGIRPFLSGRGLEVLWSELCWVIAPTALVTAAVLGIRAWRRRRSGARRAQAV